jgi:2',3'-cyclic-nucleotide 2'-phosphodiesterase (5'-nucleotidase family)
VQVSGLRLRYDPQRPAGARVLDVHVGEAPLEADRRYRVTTNSFLAEGGDGYASLREGRVLRRDAVLSDLVYAHVQRVGTVTLPAMGRIVAG